MIDFSKMTFAQIQNFFDAKEPDQYRQYYDALAIDPRKNVSDYLHRLKRIDATQAKERQRIGKMIAAEQSVFQSIHTMIAGIDEAGRGPLAGPVVAGAVILPPDLKIFYINDSKKLSEKMREKLFDEIQHHAVSIGIGIVDNNHIDATNILTATKKAMLLAVSQLSPKPNALLIDAVPLNTTIPQAYPHRADERYYSVAAASIIAKVTRDKMMYDYAAQYPAYDFDLNKGYGTAAHMAAINKFGPCPIHRKSFLKNILTASNKKTTGNAGEFQAVTYLQEKGCRILAQNYTTFHGEIDIIFQDSDYLVFCEVKTRKNSAYGTAAMAVGHQKMQKITKTALRYLTDRQIEDVDIRFDVIEIYENGSLSHIENAFMATY